MAYRSTIGSDPINFVAYFPISYASSPLGILPYLILVDKVTKNICISIRGTVGFSDLVTDLLSSPKNFNRQVSPWILDQIRTLTGRDSEEMYAHEGIVSSARALLEDLKKVGIYEAIQHLPGPISADADLLSSESSYNEPQIKEFDAMEEEEQMEFSTSRAIALIQHAIHGQKYGLVITGHSLGAAVSSIIGAELLEIFPSLRCLSYNPPGGLVDDTFRAISESFCTSIVVGQDAISRMSIQTMKRAIDDMMHMLSSQLSILLDTLIGRYVNASAAPHVFKPFESIDPDVKEVLQQYLAKAQLHQKDVDTRPMYPPGRIIFLRPYGNLTKNSKDITWDAVWIHAQDLMDEGILVSKRALSHHLLGQGMVALEKALESCRHRDGGQRA
ncbi:Sn1-specific diacylglycerol lipase alpha [Picochlorum sp. SENEW3]|nr:Sn1-specific diacylglycerol lipase alpha [Picochlorum sp. SENEW3]